MPSGASLTSSPRSRARGAREPALERRLQGARRRRRALEALARLLGEQPYENRLHGRELLGQLRDRLLAVLVDDRHGILGAIRLLPGEHLEQDDPEAVEVAARVDGLGVTLLRAHVVRGPEDGAAARDIEGQCR